MPAFHIAQSFGLLYVPGGIWEWHRSHCIGFILQNMNWYIMHEQRGADEGEAPRRIKTEPRTIVDDGVTKHTRYSERGQGRWGTIAPGSAG